LLRASKTVPTISTELSFIISPQLTHAMQNCKRVFQVSVSVMLSISQAGNLRALHFCIAGGGNQDRVAT
jgi:hypothetical protein